MARPDHHRDVEACVDAVLEKVGKSVRLALPLGIGKPILFANALYRRAEADPTISLEIYTGLTLDRPSPSRGFERRLLAPMAERLFGDSPPLDYSRALAENRLPHNVSVREFFFQPGSRLGQKRAQQDYISSNYTHVARDTAERGINVIGQLIAAPDSAADEGYSLSCNPDVTLDILPLLRGRGGVDPVMVGEVNRTLPFMGGDAAVPAKMFDHIIEPAAPHYTPFTVPHESVSSATYAMALFVSTLVQDGGTLQVGIGAFGDALVGALLLRHRDPAKYRRVLADLGHDGAVPGPFEQGLYGASEMLVDGFLELMEAGILRRGVYSHAALQSLANHGRLQANVTPSLIDDLLSTKLLPARPGAADVARLKRHGVLRDDIELRDSHFVTRDGKRIPADFENPEARDGIAAQCLGTRLVGGTVLHSGFFLGSRGFRDKLAALPVEQRDRIAMTRISFVNELYGEEILKRLQRRRAVFINNAMMVTLEGATVSDGLEDGRVVSGVGGQYNFVAMAHALDDARSVIVLPSARTKGGERRSNIVVSYGHETIPRHLRDLVVTEYGIADLRGRTDAECIQALLAIADSGFQAELLAAAKEAGKIPADYEIPNEAMQNTPDRLEAVIGRHREGGDFHPYPLGTQLTEVERTLVAALKRLDRESTGFLAKGRLVWGAVVRGGAAAEHSPYLSRMGLENVRGLADRFLRRLLVLALKRH